MDRGRKFQVRGRAGRISARAEEPAARGRSRAHQEAHLRASGGTADEPAVGDATWGASPRERRNQDPSTALNGAQGRISARAEEPLPTTGSNACAAAHLRASGGTEFRNAPDALVQGASPRERRNPRSSACAMLAIGRISARAEEPLLVAERKRSRKAHLRASGGTGDGSTTHARATGASPRERRNPSTAAHAGVAARRISARAEEPYISLASAKPAAAHLRASGGTNVPELHRR